MQIRGFQLYFPLDADKFRSSKLLNISLRLRDVSSRLKSPFMSVCTISPINSSCPHPGASLRILIIVGDSDLCTRTRHSRPPESICMERSCLKPWQTAESLFRSRLWAFSSVPGSLPLSVSCASSAHSKRRPDLDPLLKSCSSEMERKAEVVLVTEMMSVEVLRFRWADGDRTRLSLESGTQPLQRLPLPLTVAIRYVSSLSSHVAAGFASCTLLLVFRDGRPT